MKKLFEVHQKITPFGNSYRVLEDGRLAAFVRQKRFAFREHMSLFKDEDQKEVLATSQARKAIDLAPTFDVIDENENYLATIKKDFGKSLLRSSWSVYADRDLDQPLFSLQEKNKAIAIIRRLWEFIPVVSEIPFFIKFNFSILANNKQVGEYKKIALIRDHYALYLEEAEASDLDKRVWIILAILLDAMQSR